MRTYETLYIDGTWVPSDSKGRLEVVNATTEEVMATIPEGDAADVDRAVAAARRAFPGWSQTSVEERAKYLTRIQEGLEARTDELAAVIAQEVGMPLKLAQMIQVGLPKGNLAIAAQEAQDFTFEERVGNSLVVREPVGVVGCITPWNYPLHQIVLKVAPALAAGCTVVLKPSEVAPVNAFILAEVIDDVGVPAGVFNLVTGVGPVVGEAIAAHPDVDMVSFTGSTRAGKRVGELAAQTVKRVTLELGGKSANVILEDADFTKAVTDGVGKCFLNSGQTCTALTRMLVPATSWPRPRPSPCRPPRRSHRATPSRRRPASAHWCRPSSGSGCAATSPPAKPKGPSCSPAAPAPPKDSTAATSSSPRCSPTSHRT